MRIISGKYKGHKLAEFDLPHLRPTTDRVKESLFNIMQGYFEGQQILDLFSGSGNLGLEALSRGAAQVHFVDKHPQSIELLKKNLDNLKIKADFKIFAQDVYLFLKTTANVYDIIFIDPPFTEKMADALLQEMAISKVFKTGTLIAIESGLKEKIQDFYGPLKLWDRRQYGDKSLSIFQAG